MERHCMVHSPGGVGGSFSMIVNRRRVMGNTEQETLPYLKFTALEDGTFKHNTDDLEYSLDNGNTWTTLAANTDSPTVTAGNSILWRGTMTPGNKNQYFVATGRFDASGNPLSLEYNNDFVGAVCVNYQFYKLFQNCTTLVNAKDLIIPDNFNAKTHICMRMFEGCTSLISVPELPALTLTGNCYSYMFSGCTSLITPPSISATTLANNCMPHMFENCSALTSAPSLPVTTLANNCYHNMFYGCSSLTTPPALPATTLVNSCYDNMFTNCTSLTSTPIIAPTTVAKQCCRCMFSGCKSITSFNVSLPATTLYELCYARMFQGCKEMVTAPFLPAFTLVEKSYYCMFYGCTKLDYIKALFTDASATACLENWVSGVASSGTFVKNANSTFSTRGASGIPTNWTIETASE